MKSENAIRSPLLLFNSICSSVLLSKNKKALLLLFNYYLLTQYVLLFFCLKIDIKKGNLPRLPIFINLKSNTMKNTMQR